VAVLITGMGSTTAISVAKALRQQMELPVRLIGTDIHQGWEIAGSTFCDRFHQVPTADDPEYLSTVLGICEQEEIRVLFPIIDAELEVVARGEPRFRERGVLPWIARPETVAACNDKYRTYEFLERNGFPTPRTWLPEQLAGQQDHPGFPLIVKPVDGVSSRDVFYVENELELSAALRKVRSPVVQEYLRGIEYTVDVVTDQESRVLAVVPRERMQVKAGLSYKARTVRQPRLTELAGEIARRLEMRGHCNIQCRIDGEQIRFFEINPRFSGTLPLTVAAGVNSPLILLKLALGIPLERDYFDFEPGVFMARYWEEAFSRPV
jgi:carbamoyl-phosphate synthase large subunit